MSVHRISATALVCALALGSSHALAAGNADHGDEVFSSCSSCHSSEDGVNMFGPTLFGVVGRASASVSDYDYSPALQGLKVTWTPENLDKFLTDPQAMASGTKMPFKLASAQDRADVIAYLATLK